MAFVPPLLWAAGGALVGHFGGKHVSEREDRKEEEERCERREKYIKEHKKNLECQKRGGKKVYQLKRGQWAYANGELCDLPRPPSSTASTPSPSHSPQMQQQGSYFGPPGSMSVYPGPVYGYAGQPGGPSYNPGLQLPGQGTNASYYNPEQQRPRSYRRRHSGSYSSDGSR